MPYCAAVLGRSGGGWASEELDLDDVTDFDDVTDAVRESAPGEAPLLLFVEENDEWFAIVRLDDDEPRVFISDVAALEASELAQAVFDEEVPISDVEPDVEPDDDGSGADGEQSARPAAQPGGTADLLSDLGVSAGDLLALCASRGMLPIDVVSAVCERLGVADEIEVLR